MSRRHRTAGIYSGTRWSRLRRRILDRDGWRCRVCGKPGRLEADHVVPLERGGDAWDPDNLQCLCRSCHIEKTTRENTRPDPEREAWRRLVSEMT